MHWEWCPPKLACTEWSGVPPQAFVPLVQAAALMHPAGVPGREVRGTGPSLLPPHFHPTFLQATDISLLFPGGLGLQKSKDHLSLKVLISN